MDLHRNVPFGAAIAIILALSVILVVKVVRVEQIVVELSNQTAAL